METAFQSDETFTQAEFRAWLEGRPSHDINHYELLGGRIVMTPPAGYPHGAVEPRIIMALGRYLENAGGLIQGSSAGFELPTGDTLEPDVTFISASRFAEGPRPRHDDFLAIVPDLVVEILSPSTASRDRNEKKKAYLLSGVDEYWLVDPRKREVTMFHRDRAQFGAARVFRSGRVISRVAAELELTVEELFAGLD